jgi:hypothetical protein
MITAKYVRPKAASEYLRDRYSIQHSTNYLAKLRSIGGGPRFHKAGNVPLYTIDDLDAYAERRITGPLNSTAELTAA